jgi:hypothetical protein
VAQDVAAIEHREGIAGMPDMASTSDPARYPVNLEAGRSCGRAELIVVSRERKSIEVVPDQQCAGQVDSGASDAWRRPGPILVTCEYHDTRLAARVNRRGPTLVRA